MSDNENKRVLRIDINSSHPLFGKTTLAVVIAHAIKEQFPEQEVEVLSQENDFLIRSQHWYAGAPLKIQADVVQIVDINANPQPLREGAAFSTIAINLPLRDPLAESRAAAHALQESRQPDDPVNYPERPYTLDALLSRAVTSAMGKDTPAEFQAMLIVDMVRNDPMFRQAAEEFEADRGDQYEWLTTGYARPDIVVPATGENSALLLEAILKIDGLPNEWFSMDSAPKDGTPIYGIDETMENDEIQNRVEVIRWQKEGYWAHSNGEYSFQPTRWQPIRYPRASNDGLITPASVDQAERDNDSRQNR